MKILVQPGGADRRVPRPPRLVGKAPRYFEQDVPTPVELDHYIQRRLDCGDLVRMPDVPAAAAGPAPVLASAAKVASASTPAAAAVPVSPTPAVKTES